MDKLNLSLAAIPDQLRAPLIEEYRQCLRAWQLRNWELVGLKMGKLCEVVYSILKGHVSGSFDTAPSKPRNMVAACAALEQASPDKFSRSVRIQIPRLLVALYELRNNRSIGHVGGDVSPSLMDAELFQRSAKWIVGELVRTFHEVSVDEAQQIVESVSQKSVPIVWSENGLTRVLKTNLSFAEKSLVILYYHGLATPIKELYSAAEYSSFSAYKKNIIDSLHRKKMIDYDKTTALVRLLPPGLLRAEAISATF